MTDKMRVALAQIAPVWLDRNATIAKVCDRVTEAAAAGAQLVAFGEALVPGYPFWLELTGGAEFDSATQKRWFAHYSNEAVHLPSGHLEPVIATANAHQIAVYLGVIERAADRSGHSLYASLLYIGPDGTIGSCHRKLMPTYEERLVWSVGDGHGLRTHRLGAFTVGGLNCWENWMPLARAALYGQGEDLHVAVWPGSQRNTADITRFIARESRSYVLSVSGLMRPTDVAANVPDRDALLEKLPAWAADGGTAIARPNGDWLVEPVTCEERVVVAEIDHAEVRRERQNFDPAGHYSRPDVTALEVNRQRQRTVTFADD
ncbi:MAG: carbon-nitrogen hydrolase family protein [Pseudomonadota bacterium]